MGHQTAAAPEFAAVDTLPKLGRYNTGFVSVEIFSAIVFDNLKVLMKGAAGRIWLAMPAELWSTATDSRP